MTGKLYTGAGVKIQDAVSETGNGDAVIVSGFTSLVVEISGTFVATVTFQMRISKGTWTAVQAANISSGAVGTTATGTGLFYIPCAGLSEFRAPVTWTSGTSVTVEAQLSTAGGGMSLADVDIQATEDVTVSSIAAGDNNIGNVDVASIAAGDNNIGNVDIVTINSVAPQFDDTDKQAVSLYAKDAAAGDTAIIASNEGHLSIIGYERFHLHEGQLFTAHVDNAVTNIGEMTVIAFNTPASGAIHLWIEGSSTHTADLYLYENTSIDVDEGTDLPVVNRRRTGTPPPSTLSTIETAPEVGKVTYFLEVAAAAANITTTTELDHAPIVGGSGPKALGGSGSDDLGYILANSQQYAIVIVAGTNDDAMHHLDIIWTEV